MAAICLYFQVHQPYRLRRYTLFDTGPDYFDDPANAQILRKVAAKCYLPANAILLDQLRRHHGAFRVAFSFSGTVLSQLRATAPEVLQSFQELVATDRAELLGETSHHSLAYVYSPEEFRDQVTAHRQLIGDLFGQSPRVFRNTELIYSNAVSDLVAPLGFGTVLTEGWGTVLGPRNAGRVWAARNPAVRLLLRHYTLSDDIAFRFSRPDWPEYPLTAPRFAERIHQLHAAPWCNLFMDYETFGEHQPASTGILDFLQHLPQACLAAGHTFVTPSQALTEPATGVVDVPHPLSWADTARDLSAWLGNAMQTHAMAELYRLAPAVRAHGDPAATGAFRRLTTSDHFYYMSTKHHADGQVHAYFNPYATPHDAYTNFMHVLDHLRARVGG